MRPILLLALIALAPVAVAAQSKLQCTGTLEPVEVFDVRSPVPGQVVRFGTDPRGATDQTYAGKVIDFSTPVEKGTVLAQLDDRSYRAERDVAKAEVAAAEAKLAALRAANATAPDVAAAQAHLEARRAQLKLAELRLEQTTIRSPAA